MLSRLTIFQDFRKSASGAPRGWGSKSERCLASTQQVLDSANALMADAARQFRKNLRSKRPAGVRARLVTVLDELAQGRPTLVESDFHTGSAEDKAIVALLPNLPAH